MYNDRLRAYRSDIVEQHQSYRIAIESWKSIQGNQNVPLFMRGTFFERLRIACIKTFTTELMDISALNEWKVEE